MSAKNKNVVATKEWTAPRQVDNWKNINLFCQRVTPTGSFYAACK